MSGAELPFLIDMARRELRRPVHFICPERFVWPELTETPVATMPSERLAAACTLPVDCWILRTYYEFRIAGFECTLGPMPREDAINFCNVYELGRKLRGLSAFVISTRGDGYASALANCEFRQNEYGHSDTDGHYVPIWVQPGIRPRRDDRPPRVQTLAFKGALLNLDERFRSQAFRDALSERGVALDVGDQSKDGRGNSWADYSDCDAVLAIRNIRVRDILQKPASKLVNAWWGEVPALLGPEPAYRELRRSELDYFEIVNPRQALEAIDRLNASPELYRAMIERGRERRQAFTSSEMLARWVNALNGPITTAFDAWMAQSRLYRATKVIGWMLQEPSRKRRYKREQQEGPRLLDAYRSSAGDMTI